MEGTVPLALSSSRQVKVLELLIEELARPAVDIPEISQYSSFVISQMKQQNLMIIPKLFEMIKKRNEPLVLEITKNEDSSSCPTMKIRDAKSQSQFLGTKRRHFNFKRPVYKSRGGLMGRRMREFKKPVLIDVRSEAHPSVITPVNRDSIVEEPITGRSLIQQKEHSQEGRLLAEEEVVNSNEPQASTSTSAPINAASGEKQFEIIFSDSDRPSDLENGQHIIHSITERTGSADQKDGTVNVPDSFPLFQIIHNSGEELTEDMREEIVRLIKEANPKLNLNSITFRFNTPDTVDIIANVNS